MSIASEILALLTDRNSIRTALVSKGVSAAASHGYDDFAADIYAIPSGGTFQSKSAKYTTNGIRTIIPDSGYDALTSVQIEVDVSSEEPALQTKTVTPTSSGLTVVPDSGYDGLSQVNVVGDANLLTENIKKNIQIFGVTGSYEGGGGVGSLIVCTCSSNITDVRAVYGGVTVNAYKVGDTAYMNIPYQYTGIVTVEGDWVDYDAGGITRTATTSVNITNINLYTCSLIGTSIIYNAGTWNIGEHTYEGISWSQSSGYFYVLSPATVMDLSSSLHLSGTVGQSSPGYGSTIYQTANYISPPIHTNGYTKLKFTGNTSASNVNLGVGYCIGRPSGAVNWMTGYTTISGTSLQSQEVTINSSSDIEIYLAFRLTSTASPAISATADITRIEFV